MGIEIIGKLTQKNNGDFKLVDLEDVDYDGTGTSTKDKIEELVDNQITLEKDDTSFDGVDDTIHDNLTTTDKRIIGAINEVNTQFKDIVNEENKNFRVILVSDFHLGQEVKKGNLSANLRVNKMIQCINDENRKRTVDFVLVLGDLSQNSLTLRASTPRDDVKRAINSYLCNLDVPYYCIHGNHDVYNDKLWNDVFNYPKNYSIECGNFAFIMVDNFGDDENLITSNENSFGYSPINAKWLQDEINKVKTKNIILCGHWFDESAESEEVKKLIKDNILCIFEGHIHDCINMTKFGLPCFRTGNFSMAPNYDYTKPNVGWGFRNLEIRDNKLITEHILIDHQYEGLTQNYEAVNYKEVANVIKNTHATIIINNKQYFANNSLMEKNKHYGIPMLEGTLYGQTLVANTEKGITVMQSGSKWKSNDITTASGTYTFTHEGLYILKVTQGINISTEENFNGTAYINFYLNDVKLNTYAIAVKPNSTATSQLLEYSYIFTVSAGDIVKLTLKYTKDGAKTQEGGTSFIQIYKLNN